ncbi:MULTISPECIES: hypothetical protein [Sphingomonas]|uniref:Uncharacterized protein n=1 Tax=Sphingomonas leidyi TaxID=68569 RepID=A0A7X5UYU3_9SPHN|nr:MULTISPECIES: hypothetical protein [Sphingomonas]MBN8813187.1 hypothetical protein [Sphingomonas sp.]NIJ64731.1 hypothetical protein [Sphingomonas leidyi]OJY53485.1 MAG: hypothetical protein BGP17_10235 [Sphingomonas sp. 67-41]
MRESAGRRLAYAVLFAVLAGFVVAFWNPIDHLKADLRADGQGFKFSIELATHLFELGLKRL